MSEPLRYLIAEVRECAQGYTECRDRAYQCESCNGDGTRTVVTDVEVERRPVPYFMQPERLWREVTP